VLLTRFEYPSRERAVVAGWAALKAFRSGCLSMLDPALNEKSAHASLQVEVAAMGEARGDYSQFVGH
jgi:hypothetical protein